MGFPATMDFVTRAPDNAPVYTSIKLDFSTPCARVPCGKWFIKRGNQGLYKSSEKGKELQRQRPCRAEPGSSSSPLKPVNAHKMHAKCKRGMRQRLRAVPFHTRLAGARTAVRRWKAGRIRALHRGTQHRHKMDVMFPFV